MGSRKLLPRILIIAIPLLIMAAASYVRFGSIEQSGYGDVPLMISEVMTDNLCTAQDENGIYADWIEICNVSDSEFSLKDYYLSDDGNEPAKWRFPDRTIAAGEYVVVFCDRSDKVSGAYMHTNFMLNSKKETIYLSDSDGNMIDSIRLRNQECNVSYGRARGTLAVEGFLPYSTPGEANPMLLRGSNDNGAELKPVNFSLPGGVYDNDIELELGCDDADAAILYTLDGSEPDIHSNVYKAPINIGNESRENRYTNQKCLPDAGEFNNADVAYGVNEVYKATVVRARVLKDGKLGNDILTHTYFINPDYSLPLVSLVTAPENLFDERDGNYVIGSAYYTAKKYSAYNVNMGNYMMTGEHDGNIEVYSGEACALNSRANISLAGGASRTASVQKSFNIKLNENTMNGIYFGADAGYEYDALTIRGLGSAYPSSRYGYPSSFATNYLKNLGIGAQASVPCILFIDGEYWGIYFLTEPKGNEYIEQHEGVNKKDIEIVAPYEYITTSGFDSLYEQVASKDFSDSTEYSWAESEIDINNFIRFVIAEAYFANTDALKNGDHNYYLYRIPNGKWTWQAFDFDASMIEGEKNYFKALLDFKLDGEGEDKKNFSVFLFQKLWRSSKFRDEFADELDRLCGGIFADDNVSDAFDSHINSFNMEMPENLERCDMDYSPIKKLSFKIRGIDAQYQNYSLEDYAVTVHDLRRYIGGRAQSMREHLNELQR